MLKNMFKTSEICMEIYCLTHESFLPYYRDTRIEEPIIERKNILNLNKKNEKDKIMH